jgi:hypothetical protein
MPRTSPLRTHTMGGRLVLLIWEASQWLDSHCRRYVVTVARTADKPVQIRWAHRRRAGHSAQTHMHPPMFDVVYGFIDKPTRLCTKAVVRLTTTHPRRAEHIRQKTLHVSNGRRGKHTHTHRRPAGHLGLQKRPIGNRRGGVKQDICGERCT